MNRQRHFRSPELDDEMIRAIAKISPHLSFKPHDEQDKNLWEEDQNASSHAEAEVAEKVLGTFRPKRILDIGAGMGRSSIFFVKKFGWNCHLDLYDGDGDTLRYPIDGPKFPDSFCGSLSCLRRLMEFNKIENYKIINASETPLENLGTYDIIYSFYSVGFHWSLIHFMSDLKNLCHHRTRLMFTVPEKFNYVLPGFRYKLYNWNHIDSTPSKILYMTKTPKIFN